MIIIECKEGEWTLTYSDQGMWCSTQNDDGPRDDNHWTHNDPIINVKLTMMYMQTKKNMQHVMMLIKLTFDD